MKNKKAIITGASGGIGLEIAKLLASRNYQLTLVARSEDKLMKAMQNLEGGGHSVLVVDLSDRKDLEKLMHRIHTDQYDTLINNAGAGIYGEFIDLSLEEQLKIMQLNMDGLVMLSHAYLQTAKSGDSLVNIGSLIAFSSLPGAAVYAGTKGFVTAFTESLWYEFKDKGVFIMGFNPGATKSDFHLNAGKQTKAFPEFTLSSSRAVAKELVLALEKRKEPRVVQGWKNRMMLFMFKFLSRKLAIGIMGKISPGISH